MYRHISAERLSVVHYNSMTISTVPFTFVVGGIALAKVDAASKKAVGAARVAVGVNVAVVAAAPQVDARVSGGADSRARDLHGLGREGEGGHTKVAVARK